MTDVAGHRHVLVVGAGIAGLTAATTLHRAGCRVEVIEQETAHSPVGAGLILGANAVAALQFLGVDVVPYAIPIRGMRVRSARGRLLQDVPLAALGPAVGITRATLHRLLAAALPAEVSVCFSDTVTRLRTDAGGVVVDRASGVGGRVDLLVGADGLRSRVRRLAGVDVHLRYSGYTCWRALVPDPGVREAVEYWGRGERIGLVPVDGGQVYAYLVRNAPEGDPGPPDPEALARSFRGYPRIVDEVLARIAPDGLLHHDLHDLARQGWGRGRVWLLGDAAHATLPNLGQGAGMAIEDAVALGPALHVPDPGLGLDLLVRTRQARVERIRRDSRRFGAVGQWSRPAACAVRDWSYAALPAAVGLRQVRGVVEPGLELVAGQGSGRTDQA